VSVAVQAIIMLLILAAFAAPVILIWGWIRWAKRKEVGTASSILSLAGLALSTISALLALSTSAFARFHPFGFYDPTLMRIMRWGILLSFCGCLFALGGIWRKNPLRWHAPLCGLGTLAIWIIAAEGE
jgi:hypothetical protein